MDFIRKSNIAQKKKERKEQCHTSTKNDLHKQKQCGLESIGDRGTGRD